MKLILTKRSERNFNSIKEYIKNKFGDKAAEAFEQDVVDFLQLLTAFPKMGANQIQDKPIRALQLSKQTTVFYRLENQNIIILTFFDVRQNPKKKPQ